MPQFRRAVSDYWRAMEALSARLMRIFALALDLDEDFFVRRSKRHVTNMRINYYPAQERPPEAGQLRAGAHSDYGAFTILKGENAPGGLQVLRRGGDWADVPLIEERIHHQYRRPSDALDQRQMGLHHSSRGQSARGGPARRGPDVDRVLLRARSRRRGALLRKLHGPEEIRRATRRSPPAPTGAARFSPRGRSALKPS